MGMRDIHTFGLYVVIYKEMSEMLEQQGFGAASKSFLGGGVAGIVQLYYSNLQKFLKIKFPKQFQELSLGPWLFLSTSSSLEFNQMIHFNQSITELLIV